MRLAERAQMQRSRRVLRTLACVGSFSTLIVGHDLAQQVEFLLDPLADGGKPSLQARLAPTS